MLAKLAFSFSLLAAPNGALASLDDLFDEPEVGSCTNYGGPPVTGANGGNLPDFVGPEDNCNRAHCFPPQVSLIVEPSNPACDPQLGACEFRIGADIVVPENTYRAGNFTTQRTFWFDSGTPPTNCPPPPTCVPMALCGEWQLGQPIDKDEFRTYLTVNFSCGNPSLPIPHTYSLLTSACYLQSCQKSATQVIEIDPLLLYQGICRPPRKDDCPSKSSCRDCTGPGQSVSAGGDGPGLGDLGTGPRATLRYLARGAGTVFTPGWQSWRAALGRNWSHDYAMRIFLDPVLGSTDHVWLVTETASFREFWSPGVGGIYANRSPADEYRQLELLPGGGWTLHELDGRKHEFDANGRWTETRDSSPSGNPILAHYNGLAQLDSVTKPDGRSELFTYFANGKLKSISEVGVGGTESRLWQYWWSGNDLRQIQRPDGTLMRFVYADPRHPGYLSRVVLVAVDLIPGDDFLPSERVLRAFAYDDHGNVVQSWTGATAFASGFERYALSYDDPEAPTQTTVDVTIDTAPATTETVVYSIDRPSGETKPRVTAIAGTCPTCGDGANTQYFFEDVNHPYRATRLVDGNGVETELEYDLRGRTIRRVEAANNPDADPELPREATWQYHPTFESFPTAIVGPTVEGVAATRRVDLAYDGSTGDLLSRTLSGLESTYDGDGSFTPLLTEHSAYNDAGKVGIIDPPGYGATDQTSFTYDPTRGELLPLSRTDPLVGVTSWTYTPFNRVASTTDVNGVVTESIYDSMNRVTKVAARGTDGDTETDDLITLTTYNVYGDLFCVKLPEGNGVEYRYDAAGRLTELIRGRAIATPTQSTCLETNQLRERSLWQLDTFGHRKNEKLQSTTTSTWPANPDAETSYFYSTRCHLELVTRAPGTAEEAVTEYGYQDCAGNLTHVWDANHPSASHPATTLYEYDALNRLGSVRQPWGGAGPTTEIETIYRYDVQSHLVSVTDPEGNETTFEVSDRDLQVTEDSPVSGTTSRRYNEHGELVEETDARGVVSTRTVDAADRLDFFDYPDSALDVDFEFGADPDPVDFTLGRLKEIVRDPAGATPHVLSYRYDRFGRAVQDGELEASFDKNGNQQTISLPGGVVSTYTFDAMDRPTSLSVNPGTGPVSLVSGATYKPRGPLAGFTLGSTPSRTETRSYDRRYAPTSIAVSSSLLSWSYTSDDVGNILSITQALPAGPPARAFAYQDFQYFLTEGNGPWGARQWTYDKIGNRMSEWVPFGGEFYDYVENPGGGNSPLLNKISASAAGTIRQDAYGAAGHLTTVTKGANVIELGWDEAGSLASVTREGAKWNASFLYDGRGYLHRADETDGKAPTGRFIEATYSSAGQLHSLTRLGTTERRHVFYFAGRPVALLGATTPSAFSFLTTDHLGTPIHAMNSAGATTWLGGFEPFGRDWQSGGSSADSQGIFLRLPGQWIDPVWQDATFGDEIYQNVHRWYETATGRYNRSDLVPIEVEGEVNPFLYARSNPVYFSDPRGLTPFGFGAGFSIACAYALAQTLATQFPPGTNDKLKHCIVACQIQGACGAIGATAAGAAKEILDIFGPGDADFGDAIADLDGIACGFKSRRDASCTSCDSCCGPYGGGW